MKRVSVAVRVCLALLLSGRCISFSIHRAFSAQSHKHRDVITTVKALHMKESKFEEGETPSLADIINSPGISIGAGVAGIVVLLANRLSFGDIISDVQSRADIISVIACSALLLNVLSEQDITARTRDAVPLVGYALKTPQISETLDQAKRDALTWCVNTILKSTPATSVHVILDNNILARGGVVGTGDDRATSELKNTDKMAILRKTLVIGEEVYLPDLQVTIDDSETRMTCLTSLKQLVSLLHQIPNILHPHITIADIARKGGVLLFAYQLSIGTDSPNSPGGCCSNQYKSSQNIEVKRFE